MTLYLLDANVLRELKPGGHVNVLSWRRTIDDSDLRISAYTAFEIRRGRVAERERAKAKKQSTDDVDAQIEALDAFLKDFADRIVNADLATVIEWTELLGKSGNNLIDAALAATARTHDLVLVSRNEKDFAGHKVRLLNPFKWPCEIKTT